MPKFLLYLIIFILVAAFIAFAFTIFLAPVEKTRYSNCILLQNQSGQVDCFGCANNVCKDAPAGWTPYKQPEIGIPYACFKDEKGCQLAQ